MPVPIASGYLAIGFSDMAGKMGPADAYVGWVASNGVQGSPIDTFSIFLWPA
jgi:hypothetical protein